MNRVIIGIHGLKNKPPAQLLRDWWLLSIYDGLTSIGLPFIPFRFELLYWADLLYPAPLDVSIENEKDPRFLRHPYKKASPSQYLRINLRKHWSRERLERFEDYILKSDPLLSGFEGLSDRLIQYKFHDLDEYLRNETGYGEAANRPVRDVILERLASLLLRYRHRKIMIIAHSMGSIIAYDLLTQPNSPFHVDTLVTVGSPLGQPTIMAKFSSENPVLHKLKTPEGVNRWINIADLDDVVALDPTLNDDYAPNSDGVLPEDIIVKNSYTWEGSKNAHAIFGYLQTPVMAKIIYDFLVKDRSKLLKMLLDKEAWFYDNILKGMEKRRMRCPSRPERIKKHKIKRSRKEEFQYQSDT